MYGIQNGSNTIWLQLNAIILYLLPLLNDTMILHVHVLMMNDQDAESAEFKMLNSNQNIHPNSSILFHFYKIFSRKYIWPLNP